MTQTRSVEWLLAAMMLAWGVGLLFPGNTMSLPQYRLLNDLAPEFVWAAWSLTIGAYGSSRFTSTGHGGERR